MIGSVGDSLSDSVSSRMAVDKSVEYSREREGTGSRLHDCACDASVDSEPAGVTDMISQGRSLCTEGRGEKKD